MARITFSTTQELAEAARARAQRQRRSLSNYVELLIEADLRESTPDPAGAAARPEPISEVVVAISEARRLGIDPIGTLRDRIQEVERDQILGGKTISVVAA